MSLVQQAHTFLDSVKGAKYMEYWKALQELEPDLKKVVEDENYKMGREAVLSYFKPENAGESREVLSPSGRYKLVVTKYSTSKGCWGYTCGEVLETGSGKLIATVCRNYNQFPFSWVEGHVNGHDYLICGEDYQGQTVVELDTGNRKDALPSEQTYGFCWAVHRYDPKQQLLIVAGCIWGGPYEFEFHDFSDPMSGWPTLSSTEEVMDDARWPEVQEGGIIKTFTQPQDSAWEEGDSVAGQPDPAVIRTFKREGMNLTLIDTWVSEEETIRPQSLPLLPKLRYS